MDEVGWSILLLCILTPISLFFGLNSLSLRSFSRVKIQEAFRQAGKEGVFDTFLEQVESLTIACGAIRVIANTSITFLVIFILIEKHFILAFILSIFVIELFSLVIPHAWAKHTSEYVLPRTYPLLKLLLIPTKPIGVVFKLHDKFVRRLAGVTEVDPEQAQEEKQEEILSFVEQGRIEGVVDAEEVEMIENVLELDETAAEEIMTPRTDLIAINAEDDLNTILETVCGKGHSRIPVYEETIDNIIGLLYAKDMLSELGKDTSKFDLRKKMRPAYFVPESKPLRDLLHEFQNQKLHIAVVLDEYGGTAGIVTIEDILEELVGEITDEYEKTPRELYKKIDESTFELDARMYIDDVNEELEIELPEDEDYDTAGGFVFSHLGYIPKVGEKFDYENLTISVTAAGARVVKKLRIKKNPVEPQQ
ncbi:MAG: hemolysin family protein [Planctomycetota bacterium]